MSEITLGSEWHGLVYKCGFPETVAKVGYMINDSLKRYRRNIGGLPFCDRMYYSRKLGTERIIDACSFIEKANRARRRAWVAWRRGKIRFGIPGDVEVTA